MNEIKNDYFIGIYWGSRREDIATCANKLHETFNYLKSIDESFWGWYKTQKPGKNENVNSLDLSIASIELLLENGQNFNDDGTLSEDLGYRLHLKSAKDFAKAHVFSVKCGGYSEVTNLIPNNLNITLKGASFVNYLTKEIAESIYKRFNEIWSPDRGIIKIED